MKIWVWSLSLLHKDLGPINLRLQMTRGNPEWTRCTSPPTLGSYMHHYCPLSWRP
jgi:hypothetical protein